MAATVPCSTPRAFPSDPACLVDPADACARFQCMQCGEAMHACVQCYARFVAYALAFASQHVRSRKTGEHLAHHTYGNFLVARRLAPGARTAVCRCPRCPAGEVDLTAYPPYRGLLAALPGNRLPTARRGAPARAAN